VLVEADELVDGAAEEDCAAPLLLLLLPEDVDCVGVAEAPEDEDLEVLFIVRDGFAEMMLDRMLDRYALPLKESDPDDDEFWLGAAVVEDEELPLTWLEL